MITAARLLRSRSALLGLISGAALIVAGAGWLIYKRQYAEISAARHEELAAITALKTMQIEDWRWRRLEDVQYTSADPFLVAALATWQQHPSDSSLRAQLTGRLRNACGQGSYRRAALLTPAGDLLLTSDASPGTPQPSTRRLASEAARSTGAVLGDLIRDPKTAEIEIEVAAPLRDPAGRSVAVLILGSRAQDRLFPLITAWPTRSRTAEAILIRREGDDVVYLSPLRHDAAPPMSIRRPVAARQVAGVEAVLGQSGVVTGLDYRGVPVLADARAIAGSDWYLLAKADTSEIFAEARYRRNVILGFSLGTVLLAALMLIALNSVRRHRLYALLHATERGRRLTLEEMRATLRGIGDAVISTDGQGRVRRMNPVAESLTGWSKAEAQSRPLEEVFRIVNEHSRAVVESPMPHVLRDGKIVGLANHTVLIARDGVERPIAYSGAPIRDAANRVVGVVLVFRDQTEERAARRALEASERFARGVLDALPQNVAIVDAAGEIVAVNRSWLDFAAANDGQRDRIGPGNNYLDVCARAAGTDVDFARATAAGLRELLSGQASRFHIEYPCNSPQQLRRFALHAAAFEAESRRLAVLVHVDITERWLAEERQRESLRRLAMAGEIARLSAWEVDMESGLAQVSDETRRIADMRSGSLATRAQLQALLAPEYREAIARAFDACAREGLPYDMEVEMLAADGGRVWVRTTGRAVRDATGRIVKVEGATQDISRFKAQERALIDSEGRLRAAFDQAAVGIGTLDTHGHWLNSNVGFEVITGYTSAELTSRRWSDIVHPDDFERVQAEAGALMSGAMRTSELEVRLVRKDGRSVWVNAAVAPVRRPDGSVDRLMAIYQDISARKVAEGSLREARQRLETLIANVPGVVYRRRNQPGWPVEFISDGCRAVIGHTPVDFIGGSRRLDDIIHPDDRAHVRDVVRAGIAARKPYEVIYRIRTVSGAERWLTERGGVQLSADGGVQSLNGVLVDITEQQRAVAELARHREHLEKLVAERTAALEAERDRAEAASAAKSAFVANMSHEIRTPMNGVLGMLELLGHSSLSAEQAQMQRTAHESARALLHILDDVLDFSRIEAGRLQIEAAPLAIVTLAEELGESLLPLALAGGVDLSVFVDSRIPEWIVGDVVRLRQILYNLVGNAIKFAGRNSQRRGRVLLRITPTDEPLPRLQISVIDNGIGMAPQTVQQLFAPFMQAEVATTRRFGGTGLGLAITRRLVDMLGGELRVDSAPGEGSTFAVTLPLQSSGDGARRPLPDLRGCQCVLVTSPCIDLDGMQHYVEAAVGQLQRAPELAAGLLLAATLGDAVVVIRYGPAAAVAGAAARPPRMLVAAIERAADGTAALSSAEQEVALLRSDALLRAIARAARVTTASPAAPGPTAATGAPHAPVHGAGAKILVAEDDEINRAVIVRQLALLGCVAEFARDGVEALQRWRAGGVDLLLTDLHMPRMDGYALTQSIRAEELTGGARRRTPIIALTANALRSEAERATAMGMNLYLTKPTRLEDLRAALQRWLPPGGEGAAEDATAAATATTTRARSSGVLDLAAARQLLGDDPEALRAVLQDFRQAAPALVAQLLAAIRAGDLGRLRDMAHRMKSSARWVGASALSDLCAAAEEAARGEDRARVADLQERIEGAWAEALRRIDDYLRGDAG